MGVEVYLDTLDVGNATRHIINGWAITRGAIVKGLNPYTDNRPASGVLPMNTAQVLQDAVAAVIAFTGERGSPCPGITVSTYLEQFIPEIIDADAVRVRIVYKGYPAPQYEFNANLSQVETNKDASGKVVSVQYTYPSGYGALGSGDPWKGGKTLTQGGLIQRPIQEPSFTLKWVVTAGYLSGVYCTATELMSWYAWMYQGKVNDAPYTIGLWTGDKRTWMITSVQGVSRDAGRTYEARMTFQYRKDTWDPLIIFINPDNGKPPRDLIEGIGYKKVRCPDETSFPTFTFVPN